MTTPAAIREMDEDFIACRSWGHSWKPHTVTQVGRRYVVRIICLRCECIRSESLSLDGQRQRHNSYSYPQGYLVPGGGLGSVEGRQRVRSQLLANLLAHMEVEVLPE